MYRLDQSFFALLSLAHIMSLINNIESKLYLVIKEMKQRRGGTGMINYPHLYMMRRTGDAIRDRVLRCRASITRKRSVLCVFSSLWIGPASCEQRRYAFG
ncbi:hypothetical protein BOTBODRAFT_556051 [Botryobasidium botryosum FD-172 SS1]|uniref:Uncharacterized protein n=1 Tax=Botryobasidium botryosum (strain FD-172 SS1) TaxID=930990 RepID=A0A067M2E3_BOTB1|nr:hypothetical protein BOTBODRAFT_556051 [Botryobasidium botryosum FD-172 SS1]